MDSQRFDALTRRLGAAPSRRQMLSVLVTVTFGYIAHATADRAAAGCKQGWKGCPGSKPCCFGGKCRKRCVNGQGNEVCCADCFVEMLQTDPPSPDRDHPICCKSQGGTICGPNPKKKSDDRCCYPNQACVKGKCCCDGCEGAVKCGGKCCAQAACCNGECCKKGKVCATTPDGKACVPANRGCNAGPDCFAGEACVGGVCCSGARVCDNGMGTASCCQAGEYCEFPGIALATCCPINTVCKGTYRGHRVRR